MYEKNFGEEKWLNILNGQVEFGFTEEMVSLSLLKPKKINKTSNGNQCVYDGQNLYFENGILVSIDKDSGKFLVENIKLITLFP